MSMGICDVKECRRKTYMGWRSLAVSIGRQVCEYHWKKHSDANDEFDLHEVFDFPRFCVERDNVASVSRGKLRLCSCGTELLPRHRYCKECAKERERKRKREYRRRSTEKHQQALEQLADQQNIPRCKDCGLERLLGHTYCEKCARWRRQKSNSNRQKKYRRSIRF